MFFARHLGHWCGRRPLLLGLAAAMLSLALPGCARWNWRGEGFHDSEQNDAAKSRPSTGGQKSGLDARAREIENDLGVR
jgi:hypothetical protein